MRELKGMLEHLRGEGMMDRLLEKRIRIAGRSGWLLGGRLCVVLKALRG